eukprot:jgi/Picsp_1/1120/NSC_04602-R1_---NA---
MRAGNVLLQIDSISFQEGRGGNPGGADTFCCKIALGRQKILCSTGSYPLEQLKKERLEFHVEPVDQALVLLVCKENGLQDDDAVAYGIINADHIQIGDRNSLETAVCSCKSRDDLGRERIDASIFDANVHSPRKYRNGSTALKSQAFASNHTKRIDRVSPKYPSTVRAL